MTLIGKTTSFILNAMRWFEDQNILRRLAAGPNQKKWLDRGAAIWFGEHKETFPEDIRQGSRLGILCFGELPGGTGEIACWMYPVDGSKFQGVLLGEKSQVKFVDTSGTVYYEGLWGDTTLQLVESQDTFFVWLKPPERNNPLVFQVVGQGRIGDGLPETH